LRTFPGKLLEIVDRSHPFGGPFAWVLVAERIEAKVDAITDDQSVCNRSGKLAIELLDLLECSERSLGIGWSKSGYLIDRRTGCDGLKAIVEDHSLGLVVEHTSGGDQFDSGLSAELAEHLQFGLVVGQQVHVADEISSILKKFAELV
jgi:hypothetical protein